MTYLTSKLIDSWTPRFTRNDKQNNHCFHPDHDITKPFRLDNHRGITRQIFTQPMVVDDYPQPFCHPLTSAPHVVEQVK